MRDFRQRKKNKNYVFLNYFFIFFLLLVFIFFAKSAFNSYKKNRETRIEQEKINNLYLKLKDEKEAKEKRNKILKTEEGLKMHLKENYSVGEDGEYIIYITK
jgi:hypothetical protein